jgi:hypothetical protein
MAFNQRPGRSISVSTCPLAVLSALRIHHRYPEGASVDHDRLPCISRTFGVPGQLVPRTPGTDSDTHAVDASPR